MNDALDGIKSILNHYDLTPISMSHHGRVLKVTTARGTYALKSLSFKDETPFLETLNILHTQAISALPVFFTKYGEALVRTNQQCYYLTPWVEEWSRSNSIKWEILIDRLAWLHRRTNKPVTARINQNGAQEQKHYGWDRSRMALEKFIFQAEHQTYPSPFEQRILLLFHRIMADAEHARHISETLHNSEKEESSEQRVVLCHGRPKLEHILLSERGPYLINFDHAYWGSPVYELLEIFRSPDFPPDYFVRLYGQYQSVYQLTTNEKKLLMAELLKPEPFEQIMNNYREKTNQSELLFIDQLHDLCERRQQLQVLFNHIEKEMSDETKPTLDPSLDETDIESNEQNENDNVEGRRPENGSDHLENGEG